MKLRRTATLLAATVIFASSTAFAAPFAYIPNSGSSNLSVIDTATGTVVETITIESFLQAATVSPDGTRVYTSSISSGNVRVIDAFTNSVLTTIPAAYWAVYSLGLNPSGSRLYGTAAPSGLVVIDTATNTVITTITGPEFDSPQNVVVTPDGSKAYVTNAFGGKIAVVDTATNTVSGSISTSSSNRGIDVSPDGSRVYAAEDYYGLRVIDTATDAILTTVSVSGAVGVAVHPDGSKVYVSTTAGLTVVNAVTNTPITSVALGFLHFGLSVHPDGSKVYVASENTDEVFVVDTATNSSLGSIPVGNEPFARGLFIGPDFVCGDGTQNPGEECDDGNGSDTDGCTTSCQLACPLAVSKGQIIVTKQTTPDGDDRIKFAGDFTLPGAPALNPITDGARLRIRSASSTLVDVTIPPGAYTDPPKAGWKVNGAGNKWTYLNKTGAPPADIFKLMIKDKSSVSPGLVHFVANGKDGSWGVTAGDLPLDGFLMLDPATPGGLCGLAEFPGPAPTPTCAFNTSGSTLKCK